MKKEEKKNKEYNEEGNEIVEMNVKKEEKVNKEKIIKRGSEIGMVMKLKEGESYQEKYKWMVYRIEIMMGGSVDEEMKLGKEKIK